MRFSLKAIAYVLALASPLTEYMRAESARWAKVIEAANIKAE